MSPSPELVPSAAACRVFFVLRSPARLAPEEVAALAGLDPDEVSELCDWLFSIGFVARFGTPPICRYRANAAPMNLAYRADYYRLLAAMTDQLLGVQGLPS